MSEYKELLEEITPDIIIDTKGLSSPIPLLRLKKSLAKLSSKSTLQIDCSDSGLYNDLVSWCSHMKHSFLGMEKKRDYASYYVSKK